MATFQDTTGRKWTITLSVYARRQVREQVGIDPCDLSHDANVIQRLLTDDELLVNVIWVLISEAAENQDVSEIDFAKAMGGDALDQATEALLSEITDFSRDPNVRAVLKKAHGKLNTLRDKQAAAMEAALDDPKLDQMIEQQANDLMTGFLKSLGSSESTPGRSDSPNS